VRDFVSSTEMMARAFKRNRGLSEDDSLMLYTYRLASMSKRTIKDREALKSLVHAVLAEWGAWVQADEPAEDEIQEYLERVAGVMTNLYEAMTVYNSFVLAKLKEDRGIE
jgi:alpha-L-arabinofuranosidase